MLDLTKLKVGDRFTIPASEYDPEFEVIIYSITHRPGDKGYITATDYDGHMWVYTQWGAVWPFEYDDNDEATTIQEFQKKHGITGHRCEACGEYKLLSVYVLPGGPTELCQECADQGI